ncbi:hypothetical protein CA267_006075 [Alteromonas pelagimontana]|uniref:Prephenate dehydrogenase n=1 Tax=Alteromonas pelagimontana TaxID=1858656 RepID=A0A6M4MAZ7_9ALTE|nr:hypothetical protein [Alteromonas pelagimontana]QJR80371.1 hypothetical protein CA267_006075 [Alteromonas pelagimontana]
MQAIHAQLQETIQTLYRKAIDADEALDRLQQAQQGKFKTIFTKDSGFRTESKRFSPYVQEIVSDWEDLKTLDDDNAKVALPELVKKLEQILTTLHQFQATVGKA